MSDTAPPIAASTDPVPTSSKLPRKPRRWRRRLGVLLIVCLFIVVALRVVLVLALPSVLRKVAARYNLNCEYERTEMYLISGNIGIWRLTLTPKSGGDPLLAADYLRADISAANLLRGKLVVYHVEGDGIDAFVERDEHGEFPLLKQFLAAPSTAAPTKTAAAAPAD